MRGGGRLSPSVHRPMTAGYKRKPFSDPNQCHYHVKRQNLVIKDETETLVANGAGELRNSNRFRPIQHSQRYEKKQEKQKRRKALVAEEDHREWAFSTSDLSRYKGYRF